MIQEYVIYLRKIRGYSENTIKAYAKDVEEFATWLKENKEDARWSTTTRDDVDKYIIYQTEKGHSASTTNRQLAAISSIYKYFQRQGFDAENPCKYESRKPIAERIPNTIPMNNLRTAYANSRGGARRMLGILISTGIRIQEMLDLTWEDINFEENTIRVQGKGDKQRDVFPDKNVLDEFRQLYIMAKPTGKIFFFGQRKAREIIWEALRPYCRAKQLSPHAIRHSYATDLAQRGYNVSYIAKILGHKHLETTQKYIDSAAIATNAYRLSIT